MNIKAKAYCQLVNLDNIDFKQPPAIKYLNDVTIEQCRHQLLILKHPCHNQKVKRDFEKVTEALASVKEHDNTNSMIRQKIRSRKLIKRFETKMQFNE